MILKAWNIIKISHNLKISSKILKNNKNNSYKNIKIIIIILKHDINRSSNIKLYYILYYIYIYKL